MNEFFTTETPLSEAEVTVSLPPIPDQVFIEYSGQWVALRNREVVAHADNLDELHKKLEIEESDVLFHVPAQIPHYYLLNENERI
jgi:hypothetical protein